MDLELEGQQLNQNAKKLKALTRRYCTQSQELDAFHKEELSVLQNSWKRDSIRGMCLGLSHLIWPWRIVQALRNHSQFHSLVDPPSQLQLRTEKKSSLNLLGSYSLKDLICVGNFTEGLAHDIGVSFNDYREGGSSEKFTYSERVMLDVYRKGITFRAIQYIPVFHVTTTNEGFSFMTCYSKDELSFQAFLKPFEK
ncbi:hypothetical protein Fcan01_19223 [Folsomia candida]|uniref:Uncharacterized protein n=1 Tax=Folsomia candida TaxID=158441 RepID=A0A226DKX0_FOLCA|nr:hypothetical protein Fcan01_19223 [Folsomia candida]